MRVYKLDTLVCTSYLRRLNICQGVCTSSLMEFSLSQANQKEIWFSNSQFVRPCAQLSGRRSQFIIPDPFDLPDLSSLPAARAHVLPAHGEG